MQRLLLVWRPTIHSLWRHSRSPLAVMAFTLWRLRATLPAPCVVMMRLLRCWWALETPSLMMAVYWVSRTLLRRMLASLMVAMVAMVPTLSVLVVVGRVVPVVRGLLAETTLVVRRTEVSVEEKQPWVRVAVHQAVVHLCRAHRCCFLSLCRPRAKPTATRVGVHSRH